MIILTRLQLKIVSETAGAGSVLSSSRAHVTTCPRCPGVGCDHVLKSGQWNTRRSYTFYFQSAINFPRSVLTLFPSLPAEQEAGGAMSQERPGSRVTMWIFVLGEAPEIKLLSARAYPCPLVQRSLKTSSKGAVLGHGHVYFKF